MNFLKLTILLAALPLLSEAKSVKSEPVPCFIPRPQNMVPDRSFVETDRCPEWPDSEKKQYAPVTDELPLFDSRESEAEYVGGAYYREEKDLNVVVQPDYTTTGETIEEEEPVAPTATEHSS